MTGSALKSEHTFLTILIYFIHFEEYNSNYANHKQYALWALLLLSVPGRRYRVVRNITVMSTELMVILNNAPGSYANANHSSTALGAFQQQCITNLSCHTCQH